MKLLLINPNRYMNPPVIPLGIEYLACGLENRSVDVAVLDLCFSNDPVGELDRAIDDLRPDAIGVTIRNLDSVLYPDTEFFLPEIRMYVQRVKERTERPVIIGGAALAADPEGILDFVGADIAVLGPGEETLPALLMDGSSLRNGPKVVPGSVERSFCPQRKGLFDYGDYLAKDGIPGFETHKGCSSRCVYCIEAGTAVWHREVSDVVAELGQLAELGFNHLHLCDSEFNENLDFCVALLEAMNDRQLGLRWAVYMKPGTCNPRMVELLSGSGAYLVTLTVDTFQREERYWSDVESMIALCRDAGIRTSIDFLTGFPGESEDVVKKSLDFFTKARPDEVVVNVFLRLYESLAVTRIVQADHSLSRFVTGQNNGDGLLLHPVFYNHVPVEKLKETIGGDRMFRIAGDEKVVNYQKA